MSSHLKSCGEFYPLSELNCVLAAISVGLCEFLLGFVLAGPFWLVGLVPAHHYASLAVQLGSLASYGLILAAIPFLRLLHHSPGSQAAIVTALGWQSLCVRWFCVEDDRQSKLSLVFTSRLVRDVVFLVAFIAICWTSVLGWKSFRSSGVWAQRFWLLVVFGELFAVQEFYRNAGEHVDPTIKRTSCQNFPTQFDVHFGESTPDSTARRKASHEEAMRKPARSEGPTCHLSQRSFGHHVIYLRKDFNCRVGLSVPKVAFKTTCSLPRQYLSPPRLLLDDCTPNARV